MDQYQVIAYYPYCYNTNLYHGLIQEMISEKYFVIDYNDLRNGHLPLGYIDVIYLNWIEDNMGESDRELILKAVETGIRVFWVFHNRVSHNRTIERECKDNITFLLDNVSDIIILSHASINYLYEYQPELNQSKIHYLPHPEYIGSYGALENSAIRTRISESTFVFGCIGTIRDDKNIELVIKAFKQFPYRQKSKLFITGGVDRADYLRKLETIIDGDSNIVLLVEHIPDYMMNFYVQSADVLVLPYDVKSCMNSGVMLLAFTNKKSVIVSDICMTKEFDQRLFYCYSYADEQNHIAELTAQMKKSYEDGRKIVREKGEKLYAEILKNNSKDMIKEELYKILSGLQGRHTDNQEKEIISTVYPVIELWRRRYMIADAWNRNIMEGNNLIKHLKDNAMKKIAIYGFGKYGKMLYGEMLKQGVPVTCVIDQNADKMSGDVLFLTLNDLRESLDLVIVTVAVNIEPIRLHCREFNENCYVFNLGDI